MVQDYSGKDYRQNGTVLRRVPSAVALHLKDKDPDFVRQTFG
jgi:hypothetical protein